MGTPRDGYIKQFNGIDFDLLRPKTIAANIVSGELDPARIPNIPASKVTTGEFNVARIPNLSGAKITTGTVAAARIDYLDASKINSGIFAVDRIPTMDASKINSGTFNVARIPNLDASKITSGTLSVARLPSIAITSRVVATTLASYMTIYGADPTVMQEGDILILTTDNETYIHNGGSVGDATDFNKLETPTDAVASVNGYTGVVNLNKTDLSLGNVPNVDATNPANIVQNASYRFVTDTEKATWNGKVDTLADLSITANAADINKLDGMTASQTELNYLVGVTGLIQGQLDAKERAWIVQSGDPTYGPSDAGRLCFVY